MNSTVKIFIQYVVCALSFFGTAFVCCLIIFGFSPNRDWVIMLFTAPFSAAVVGVLAWSLLTSFGSRVKVWKGITVGILAGSVSHFFAWYLSIVFLYLQKSVTTSLGEPTVGPIDGVWASLVMSLFSLAVIGWMTIPVGGIVGALLAVFSQRFLTDRLS